MATAAPVPGDAVPGDAAVAGDAPGDAPGDAVQAEAVLPAPVWRRQGF